MEKKELNCLVGANIKREREKAGLTQEEFSERIGLGVKSLSAVERGVVGISLTTLLRICQVLSISSDILLFPRSRENDVAGLVAQLNRLPQEQFQIAVDTLGNLFKAFSSNEE